MKKPGMPACSVIIALIVLCLFAAGARAGDPEKQVRMIEDYYRSLRDFHARFEQETHMSSLKHVERGNGEVYFKKGGKMLWNYLSPNPQKIILDGKHFWVYLPEERQAMKNTYSALPSHIVSDLFQGTVSITKQFSVSCVQEARGKRSPCAVLKLVPREYNPSVTELVLSVDNQTHAITTTRLTDEFGNRTILRFRDIAVNKGIQDSLFTFVPPPGVDVFEPPRQHTVQ